MIASAGAIANAKQSDQSRISKLVIRGLTYLLAGITRIRWPKLRLLICFAFSSLIISAEWLIPANGACAPFH